MNKQKIRIVQAVAGMNIGDEKEVKTAIAQSLINRGIAQLVSENKPVAEVEVKKIEQNEQEEKPKRTRKPKQ